MKGEFSNSVSPTAINMFCNFITEDRHAFSAENFGKKQKEQVHKKVKCKFYLVIACGRI